MNLDNFIFTFLVPVTLLQMEDKKVPEEEEISLAVMAILAVGTFAMLALLSCYICVFRQLCCQPPPNSKRRRIDSNFGHDDLQMGDTTQNVEISLATGTDPDQR